MAVDMTLAEAMAVAVLRGDQVAALALADRLIEERQNHPATRELDGVPPHRLCVTSAAVFQWPEFAAFALRLGIEARLPTTSLTIELRVGEAVRITQHYLGAAPPEGSQAP